MKTMDLLDVRQLKTKADVVKYAIEYTAETTRNPENLSQATTPNYEKAQALIDFFNRNVTLPETDTSVQDIVGMMREALDAVLKSVNGEGK